VLPSSDLTSHLDAVTYRCSPGPRGITVGCCYRCVKHTLLTTPDSYEEEVEQAETLKNKRGKKTQVWTAVKFRDRNCSTKTNIIYRPHPLPVAPETHLLLSWTRRAASLNNESTPVQNHFSKRRQKKRLLSRISKSWKSKQKYFCYDICSPMHFWGGLSSSEMLLIMLHGNF